MIPLKDLNPRRNFPIVTVAFIIINIVVFAIEMISGTTSENAILEFFDKWAFIPAQFLSDEMLAESITLITSMFLHGGVMHLVGNMWFLWVFGDNIEDKLGPVRYFFFYILCGILAAFAQVLFDFDSTIPMVGASGAIAGVLGAYLILFPKVPINTLIFFIFRKKISALFVLGFWFAMQFMSGIGSIGASAEGGTAFFAHIGGFLAGMGLIFLFRKPTQPTSDWDVR